jgi:hypothetical protein
MRAARGVAAALIEGAIARPNSCNDAPADRSFHAPERYGDRLDCLPMWKQFLYWLIAIAVVLQLVAFIFGQSYMPEGPPFTP